MPCPFGVNVAGFGPLVGGGAEKNMTVFSAFVCLASPCSLAGFSRAYMRLFLCGVGVLTLTKPQATHQRVGLGLHCTLEPEVEASGSGSTASLWSLRLGSPAWALKARVGDFASDSRGSCRARDRGPRAATVAPKESPAAALTLPDKTRVSGSMPPSEYDVVRHPSRLASRPASIPSHHST
ncbi:unnamed protein product [Caenorhabditis auriculariae]|uniref:Uncharacterized protein n=1 Tax=Caenorhabditis auriculariae TaxID=2777116 RepID=A0A8S1HIG2_9PELO|nr:unnamed protein product [Caenorhabditis auriculariae]